MSRRSKISIGAGFLVLLSLLAVIGTEINLNRVSELPGTGELIIMDELSLWHSPANSGISYDRYEPLRVRRKGAEYFHRTNTPKQAFAASGRRYGEIKLTENNGGLLYLPRWLAYDLDDELKLSLWQSGAQGQWRISIYPTANKVAHITASTPGVTITAMGNWSQITIPLSALSFEPYELKMPEKENWHDPNYLLAQYDLPQGYLYGLEFSIDGGKPADSLYIDHIALQKKSHTQPHKLTGRLKPPIGNAEIVLRSDKGEQRAKPSWTGLFEIDIPQDAKIIEVVAETADKVMSPRSGRFLEIGTYLPNIVIPTGDPELGHTPMEGDSNTSLYIYEERYGPRITPNEHFLVQATVDGDQVMAAELATNRFGYIDRDRRPENPDQDFRVMVLGDSHHMGVHIAEADNWWNEAEAVATMRAERPIEVISASFHHASWTSSWPAFRDLGKDLAPDIVLLPIMDPGILNLTIEEYIMDWLGASAGHRPSYQFELGPDGKIIHKPNDPDWELYREPFPEEEHTRVREQYVSVPYVHADPAKTPEWVKQNVKLSIASLKEFAKLAKQRKTRFAILYISNYGSSKKETFVENGQTYDPNKFRDLMRNMAEESGLEFIDIADDFHMSMSGKDAPRMFYNSNSHFTPYAHYRYGQVLGNLFSSWVNTQ